MTLITVLLLKNQSKCYQVKKKSLDDLLGVGVTHVLPHQARSVLARKSQCALMVLLVACLRARHVLVMFCWLRDKVGGAQASLLNQLLGLKEATKVEDLPSG